MIGDALFFYLVISAIIIVGYTLFALWSAWIVRGRSDEELYALIEECKPMGGLSE